jgi:DNA mismatch repair protein MutL
MEISPPNAIAVILDGDGVSVNNSDPFTTPQIRLLPPDVISRIAAGEVIERPSSVLKELVENALDAGAQHIRVDISGGGSSLIRVSDDGSGMGVEDILLCIQPHATSKLDNASQITSLCTLGFRGEALPSIAAVSKFTLTSYAANSTTPEAWRIELVGGLPHQPQARPAGAVKGTTVEVRDLFFNLPARARFLKGAASESAACTETLLRLALSRPDAAFTLYQDQHEIIDLPICAAVAGASAESRSIKQSGHAAPKLPASAFQERARAVIGGHNAKGLLAVDTQDQSEHFHGYRVFGLLSPPAITRPNRAQIFLCVNGRPVKDRTLTSALLEAYRHLLPPRRYPLGVLYLELPTQDVDINVHPTKAEVRFRAPGLVYSLLHHTVRVACGVPTTTSVQEIVEKVSQNLSQQDGRVRADDPQTSDEFLLKPAPLASVPATQPHLDLWPHRGSVLVQSISKVTVPHPNPNYGTSDELSTSSRVSEPVFKPRSEDRQSLQSNCVMPSDFERTADVSSPTRAHFRVLGQVGGSYIVLEDESGVKLIDQHALHERILFEGLMSRAQTQARGDSQGLLIPEIFELTPVQSSVFLEDLLAQSTLADLGFVVELSDARSLKVKAIPAWLSSARHKPARAVADVLEALASTSDDVGDKKPLTRAYYREKAAYVLSCKGAIKAGERLVQEQMVALVTDFKKLVGESGFTCPHGRPLALEISWADLEKAVGRT